MKSWTGRMVGMFAWRNVLSVSRGEEGSQVSAVDTSISFTFYFYNFRGKLIAVLYDILAFLNQISESKLFGLQIGTDVDTSKYLILNYGIEDKVDSDVKRGCVSKKLMLQALLWQKN